MLTRQLKHFLAQHRRSRVARRIDRYLVDLHQAYENRNYDFDRNGERRLLCALEKALPVRTVFDVGANVGDWTRLASSVFEKAQIFSFEIVSGTYLKLAENCRAMPNVTLNQVGLSDQRGEVDVFCPPDATYLATSVEGIAERFHHLSTHRSRSAVITGDEYCADRAIGDIDFLKIDVEGMEDRVLRGFSGMLKSQAVKVVQFEYGYVNAATKFLLKDFYDFFGPLDMVIGKVYPTYVDFREYRLVHEDFLGPNYVAVQSSLKKVIEALN